MKTDVMHAPWKTGLNQRDSGKVIVFVAMEGWAQKGGQGDYVRELSQALARQGHQVLVINPYYNRPHGDISADKGQWLFDIDIPVGGGTFRFGIFCNHVGDVCYLRFKDPTGLLYQEVYPSTKIGDIIYSDTLYGYIEAIVLSRIGEHIVMQLDIKPDIMHFNDWQSGLGTVYMEEVYRYHPAFMQHLAGTGTVITVHNLAYQGIFPGTWLATMDDPLVAHLFARWIVPSGIVRYHGNIVELDLFSLTRLPGYLQSTTDGGLEYWSTIVSGRHNLLKGGLEFADTIVAVSKGNFIEMQSDRLGFGLGGIIARRAAEGAVDYVYNGVDSEKYNPEHFEELQEVVDTGLAFKQFNANSHDLPDVRTHNKMALRVKINKLIDSDRKYRSLNDRYCFGRIEEKNPADILVASVSRIVRQKGLDILITPMNKDRTFGVKQGDRLIDVLMRLRGPRGEKFQFLLLGTPGDIAGEKLVKVFINISQQYTGQFAVIFSFDRRLSNQIRCASDLFFMPSQYEPAGISNIQAALAGSLCVLTFTGGLIDFVEGNGTHPGLVVPAFDYDYPHTLKETARFFLRAFITAMNLYSNDKQEWYRWVRTAMQFHCNWSSRVNKYVSIYERCRSIRS